MQTFLPVVHDRHGLRSCYDSAAVLDWRRLGKQRVEALQIANVLTGKSVGWQHHPAVRMWRGHLGALVFYGRSMCSAWIAMGYRDTCWDKFPTVDEIRWPEWMFDPQFAASHRSNLLRKDPSHYGQFGWTESADMPYVWPV